MRTREKPSSYDQLAAEYANRFCGELDGKPFDRSILRRFAEAVRDGQVCDVGCGPGHVAAHLASLGVTTVGIDKSPQMIAEAKCRFASIDFQVGDMLSLPLEADSLAGIVAFYSIICLKRSMLLQAFREMNRVLRPGGLLLVSFHRGYDELHEDRVWGTEVSLDCTLFEPDEVARALQEADFSIAETTVRRPYETEYPTQRVYIVADARAS